MPLSVTACRQLLGISASDTEIDASADDASPDVAQEADATSDRTLRADACADADLCDDFESSSGLPWTTEEKHLACSIQVEQTKGSPSPPNALAIRVLNDTSTRTIGCGKLLQYSKTVSSLRVAFDFRWDAQSDLANGGSIVAVVLDRLIQGSDCKITVMLNLSKLGDLSSQVNTTEACPLRRVNNVLPVGQFIVGPWNHVDFSVDLRSQDDNGTIAVKFGDDKDAGALPFLRYNSSAIPYVYLGHTEYIGAKGGREIRFDNVFISSTP